MRLKPLLTCCVTIAMLGSLNACVVEPVGPEPRIVHVQPIAPPVGVVYVAPTVITPGEGWRWAYHPHLGYGWYHPKHGWRH